MTKGKQDKSDFKDCYLPGRGPGCMVLPPAFFDEEERKKEEEELVDADTSHLSDERYHKHSPHALPKIKKRGRSYSFVR